MVAFFSANLDQLKPNLVEKLPGGLNGIPAGLVTLSNKVSAKKLVAVIDETA